jgi:hypothetical protein
VRPALETPRQQPQVSVHFSAADRRYDPLALLRARYEVMLPAGTAPVRAVERSVVWYTEGKGEEDIGVHSFERITDRGTVAAAATAGMLETPLPRSPLSYEGLIVKIRWCVRVRLFFEGGRDFVSEHVFDVGRVPAAALP